MRKSIWGMAGLCLVGQLFFAGCGQDNSAGTGERRETKVTTADTDDGGTSKRKAKGTKTQGSDPGSTEPAETKTAASPDDSGSTEPQVIVSGRITFEDGKPVTSATVKLTGIDRSPTGGWKTLDLAEGTAGSDGKYEIKGPNKRLAGLSVTTEGGASVMAAFANSGYTAEAPTEQLRREKLDVVVPRAVKIAGSVVDDKGAPVPQPLVRFYLNTSSRQKSHFTGATTTGTADGKFELTDAMAGSGKMTVSSKDHVPHLQDLTVPTTEPLVITLKSGGGTVRGTAYHKATGAPVSSATVGLQMTGMGGGYMMAMAGTEGYKTTTDLSGNFEIKHIAETPFTLYAGSESPKLGLFPSKDNITKPIKLADAETTTVNFFLYEGHTVSGIVFDQETSEPIESAKVAITSEEASAATTAADGRYNLKNVLTNRGGMSVSITATAEGYMPHQENRWGGEQVNVTLSEDSLEASRDIPMVKTVSVKGKVLTRDGQPVSTAEVYPRTQMNQGNEKKTKVKPDGTYEIEVRPFTEIVVMAAAKGFANGNSKGLSIDTRPVENVDITMDVGAVISGVVVDPEGKPVEAANVSGYRMVSMGNSSYGDSVSGDSTNAAGEFTLTDVGGEPQISASKEGFASSESQKVAVKPGEVKSGVRIQLRKGFVISGKVMYKSGKPVPNTYVNLRGPSNTGEQTKEDGTFIFKSVAEGVYTAQIYSPSQVSVPNVPAGKTDVEIIVPDPEERERAGLATLIGKLVDEVTNEPVTDFTPPSNATKVPDEPGTFRHPDLQQNSNHSFEISAPGYAKTTFEVTVPKGGGEFKHTFKIGKGGIVIGRVISQATGQPVQGVQIVNWGAEQGWNRQYSSPKSYTSTDAEGKFTLAPVSPGQTNFEIKPDAPLAIAARAANVQGSETTDLGDIPLFNGGKITGKLLMRNDDPVVGDTISAGMYTQELRHSASAQTGADGSFEFTGLPAGNFSVSSQKHSVTKQVEVAGSDEKTVELRVGGTKMSGKITRRGAPMRVSISLRHTESGQSASSFAETGEYKIEGLLPGAYTVNLHPQEGNYNSVPAQQVEVPDQPEFSKDFQLSGGRIQGSVVDSAGATIAGATIAIKAPEQGAGYNQVWYGARTITSKADGSFEIDGLASGSYGLTARKQDVGTAAQSDIAVSDNDVQVQLVLKNEGGGTLESVALSMEDGSPIQAAWCYLTGPSGSFPHDAVRDPSGLMRITNIPPGMYDVNVSTWSYSNAQRQVEIKAGETVRIEDVLYLSGALNWTIRTASGQPAAGAKVSLVPLDPSSTEQPKNGITSPQGLYVERGLAPGQYRATATLDGKPPVSEVFNITARGMDKKETAASGW